MGLQTLKPYISVKVGLSSSNLQPLTHCHDFREYLPFLPGGIIAQCLLPQILHTINPVIGSRSFMTFLAMA